MPHIIQLDELTINQIAAGEVIERPASVVKELVENSIDAKATRITVEVTKGGIDTIKIVDNGIGIAREDLENAFERHATSKIKCAKDIENVTSMGFRGEALASVAAIAKVEMITKTKDAPFGHKIVVEAGKIKEISQIGAPSGTTIIIKDIFFNTPVRYKFLKKDYTEVGYIDETLKHLALVNKNIAFKLINNDKVLLNTTGDGDFKSVIYSIFGQEVSENILEVENEKGNIKIEGVVGKPSISRSNRKNQIFFVNKRYIKDKFLSTAVEKAFKGMIPLGRFGFCVLNLTMPGTMVDVNVHPAKLEVRFQNENEVFKLVYDSVKAALTSQDITPSIQSQDKFDIRYNMKEDIQLPKYDLKENKQVYTEEDLEKTNQRLEKIKQDFFAKANIQKANTSSSNIDQIINAYNQKHGSPSSVLQKWNEVFYQKDQQTTQEPQVTQTNESVEEKEEQPQVEQVVQESVEVKFDTQYTPNMQHETVQNIEEQSTQILPDLDVNKVDVNKFDVTSTINHVQDDQATRLVNIQDTPSVKSTSPDATMAWDGKHGKHDKVDGATQIVSEPIKEQVQVQEQTSVENGNTTTTETVVDNKIFEAMQTGKLPDMQSEANGINPQDVVVDNIQNNKFNTDIIDTEKIRQGLQEKNNITNFDSMYEKAFGTKVVDKIIQQRMEMEKTKIDQKMVTPIEGSTLFKNGKVSYKIIGVIFNTYIIIETKDQMYIIDQHAAHERVLFEKVKKNYYSNDKKDMQVLLLPDIITLSYREYELAKDNKEIFTKAGFEFEEFGINTIKLTTVPSMCEMLNTKELFLDILDELDTKEDSAKSEVENRFLATVACKAAIKAGMKIAQNDLEQLLEELLELQNPFTCPHGRPTTIGMSKIDIEKKFSRRK